MLKPTDVAVERPPRVLVADDERHIARALAHILQRYAYEVTTVDNGEAALQVLQEAYLLDLVILDIVMPFMDGLEVLRRARAFGCNLPVIIVSGKNSEADRIRGLEAGADDYLGKPFGTQELLARVEALRRRRGAARPLPKRIRIGDVWIDFEARVARRGSNHLLITPIEWLILRHLAYRRGQAVSRGEFNVKVLKIPYDIPTRTIDRHTFALRHKLERNPKNPHHIVTVRSVGYRLNDFEWIA